MTVTHAQPENPHALETLFELATDHAHFFTLTDNDQHPYMAMMAGWVFLGRREKSNMEKGVAVYCYLQVTLDVHDLTKHTNNTDAVAIFPINSIPKFLILDRECVTNSHKKVGFWSPDGAKSVQSNR